jgi:hypothetical protein
VLDGFAPWWWLAAIVVLVALGVGQYALTKRRQPKTKLAKALNRILKL